MGRHLGVGPAGPAPDLVGLLEDRRTLFMALEASETYSGKAIKPKPSVTVGGRSLSYGSDYTLSYKANKKAGKATVLVQGTGNYSGSSAKTFKIKKAAISKAKASSIGKKKYTGSAIESKPKVRFNGKKLKLGRDYKLSYKDNVAPGTAKVVIAGKGNFKGKKTVSFKISAPQASANSASGAASSAGSSSGAGEVYITRTGGKYHLSWCTSLRSSRIPISRADAEARGYEACKICKP